MIGERVRLAREACLLTQQQLAEASEISQATLSEIEAGRIAKPSQDVIENIADATQFPMGFFFLGPLPDLPDGRYRKLKRGTSKVGKQVRAQVRQVLEVALGAEDSLKLPPVSIDPVRHLADLVEVEDVAAKAREWLGVGSRDPVPNLTRAVERAGVLVIGLASEMKDHDGFSAWPDYGLGGRPLIALARSNPGDKNRFTLAHELGHLILHTHRAYVEPSQAETEAHRFAGALLLPKEAALESLKTPLTLQRLKGVKATFGVSIAMATRRAYDLNLITKDHYMSLNKQLSARGWRKSEPVEVQQETPMLIGKILSHASGSGSIKERADRVHMPVFSYSALAG